MPFVDIELKQNENGIFDFSFSDGDFNIVEGFEMALLMSVLCEQRAESSEVAAPEMRRGWWGNEAQNFEEYNIGSKLWLLYQARSTTDTLNNALTFVRDGLNWFIEDSFLSEVNVTAEYRRIDTQRVLDMNVDLVRFQNSVASKGFRIWQNTGRVEVVEK